MKLTDFYDNGLRTAWDWIRYLGLLVSLAIIFGVVSGLVSRLGMTCT